MLDERYLAGLFDGEGCVHLTTKDRLLVLVVSISNTNKELMDKLRTEIGGRVYEQPRSSAAHRPGYNWRVTGSKAVRFLKSMSGHLIVKREVTELAIAAFTMKECGYLTPELAGQIVGVARNLNRRGIVKCQG